MDNQVANVQLMQKMNRLKVLNYIRNNPDSSRPQIAEGTGLSLPSITNVTSYLLELGIVCENGIENVSRVGRKRVLLRLCAEKFDLICVFLNEDSASVARTDLAGTIKERNKFKTSGMSQDEIIRALCDEVVKMISSAGKERVLGIGVAISGLVLDDSRFVMSARLKWKSFNIKSMLEEMTGVPVFVDNASLLAAVWYFSENADETKGNMLFVDLENGIGTVQYLNNEIQRSTVGEVGHTTVEKDGPQCFCGNRGCLEMMCSPQRLISLYETSSAKSISDIKEVEELYRCGDENAISAVSDCGGYLGIGFANLVNLFNPSVFVINAGDFSDCPSVLTIAENEIYSRAYSSLTESLSVDKVKSTENDIIYGTAYNLFNKLFDISFAGNIIE